jgi:hypothetical protein
MPSHAEESTLFPKQHREFEARDAVAFNSIVRGQSFAIANEPRLFQGNDVTRPTPGFTVARGH